MPAATRENCPLNAMSACANRKAQAAAISASGAWRSQIDQATATAAAIVSAAPSTIVSPNVNAPRASAGRPDPQYSSQERTISVSWPQSAATLRNDVALKMMASAPNATGSMWRAASANMQNPRIDP